ncbi:MAG: CYCXC family (seleno)protein [Pyrinomonadaceae bacterium]
MKTKVLSIAIALLALGAGMLIVLKSGRGVSETRLLRSGQTPATPAQTAPSTEASPSVPSYQLASEVRSLPPTLEPSRFVGKAREAYRVAKEIPQTLAQLPCYCHCDRSFGHKSLHTCFVDNHAAQCAVCVDEALLAFQLQQKEKLTPEQVRDRIIEKYSGADHNH